MRWAFLLGLSAVTFACEDSAPRPLSNTERELVAQGYADSVRTLASLTDSLCEMRQPDLVAYFADSLYEVRLGDIERQASLPRGQ